MKFQMLRDNPCHLFQHARRLAHPVEKDQLHRRDDILVEQLNGRGYALNAIEGMASGLPVISNNQENDYMQLYRNYSFFNECPIVSTSIESLEKTLELLIINSDLRKELGICSRKYAEKYHGLDSSQYLFSSVIDFLNGKEKNLIDLFHPLKSDYVKRKPIIKPPLFENKIIG